MQSSTSMSAATAVTGFVMEEMRKMASSATGVPPPASSVPATPRWTSPFRATSHETPTTPPLSTWPPTISSSRLIPSVVNPALMAASSLVHHC